MMLRCCILALVVSATAQAMPWRFETGLPPAPPPGQPFTIPEPVSVDGVEHPFTRWRQLSFGLLADAFITYRLVQRQATLFNEFELSRLQLSGWVSYGTLAGANVTFEAIRSSGGRSYFGVDGDSIVPRFKWAFAEVTPLRHWLSLRGGLIPDLLLQFAESSWSFRAQGPTGLERDQMFLPADLGVSIEASLPWGLGSVAASYGNGEGVTLREQNDGKNTTVALRIAPGRYRLPRLLLHLAYRDGSLGAGSAADHRLAGGITYAGRRLGAGAIGTWAIGWRGNGNRDAGHLTLWARGELPLRFYLFARADLLWPDVADSSSMQARVLGGLAYALPALVRILLGYEGTIPVGTLVNQVPAIEEHALLIQIEARL